MSQYLYTKYGGTLPSFNPLTFKTSTILADDIYSNNLLSNTVSSQSMILQDDVSSSEVATKEYVDNKVDDLIGGAGPAYDTLLEIQNELQDDDNVISSLLTSVANKVSLSGNENVNGTKNFSSIQLNNVDLSERLLAIDISVNGKLGITEAQNTYSTLIKEMQLDSKINDLSSNVTSSVNSLNTSVSNLNSKTNFISVSGSTTTITSRLTVNGGTNGSVQLGDNSNDTLNVLCGTTNFVNNSISSNAVNGLNSRLTNVDTSLNNLRSNSLYSNTHILNCGVDRLSTILNSIGNSSGRNIIISAGEVSGDVSNNITCNNLTMCGPDSAFGSPSTVIFGDTTLSGSSMIRCRISNVQFSNPFTIIGTLGRHTFKGVVFNSNFTLEGSTSDFLMFYYCSFSAQVNIPNTFAGYIVFYFCDFQGATLNFNNTLPQQVYINSCINLPNLTLNALLDGYNRSTSSSALNTSTLNCSGNVALPANSVSMSSINGLTSSLSLKADISDVSLNYLRKVDASNNYALISSLNATNNNVSSLQSSVNTLNSKTGALSYDVSSGTTVINSRLQVTGDEFNSGSVYLGDNSGNDIIYLNGTISAGGQSVSATKIGFLSSLTSDVQTQMNSKAPRNNPTFTGTVSGITKAMVGLGNVDNISDISKGISIATQAALDLKSDISYVDLKVAQLVGSAPSVLDTIQEIATALGNDNNFSTTITNAIGLRALDSNTVHKSGDEDISGQKNFLTGITLNGQNLNTRLTNTESNVSSLQSSVNTLNSKTGALTFDPSLNTTVINSRLQVTGDEFNSGSVYLGDNSGNDIIYLNGTISASGQSVSATKIGYLNTLTGNVQNQLNSRALITDVSNTYLRITDASNNYLRITDANNALTLKANSLDVSNTYLSINDASNNYVRTTTYNNGLSLKANISDVSASFLTQSSASSTYALQSSLNTTNSNVTNLTSIVNNKANALDVSASFLLKSDASDNYLKITDASNNYVRTTTYNSGLSLKANISDVSASFLTQSLASSTYMPINNGTATGNTGLQRVTEQITNSGSGTALSLSYTSINGVVLYAPSANYALTLTNVPTTSNTTYTLTFVYTTKFYANSININGSARTMVSVGGLSNISVNSSATHVMQTISICYLNSATPTVFTTVVSCW